MASPETSTAGDLTTADLEKITLLAPDIVLLAGGAARRETVLESGQRTEPVFEIRECCLHPDRNVTRNR